MITLLTIALFAQHPSELGAKDEPRVVTARKAHADAIAELFAKFQVPYPAPALLFRVFKQNDALEVWAQPAPNREYVLLKTYPICARSGGPGPKSREGDLQVPEGFYSISTFNPTSNFLLSMKVDYPNAADRKRSAAKKLGGDIFIHGSCVTIGCVPLGDEAISELYVIARDTKKPIAVHIFPGRMNEKLEGEAENKDFWDELRPGYDWFEAKRTLPRVKIDPQGHYRIAK